MSNFTKILQAIQWSALISSFIQIFANVSAEAGPDGLPVSLYTPVVDGKQFKFVGLITEVK